MGVVSISDELLRRIERIAAADSVPLERKVEDILEAGLRREPSGQASFRAAFDAVAAMTPKGVAQTDSLQILREERDR